MRKVKYKQIKVAFVMRVVNRVDTNVKGRKIKRRRFLLQKKKKTISTKHVTLKTTKLIFLIKSVKWLKKKVLKRVKKAYTAVLQQLVSIKKIKKRKKRRGIFTDVYSLGYKFYKKLRSFLREYRIRKKKQKQIFLPQKMPRVRTIKKQSLVKIKDLREVKENKKVNMFLIYHKKIENIFEKIVEKEFQEERSLRFGEETVDIVTDHDSELNLYLCELFFENWINFCWYKAYLIKKNLLLYRNHARSLQTATKRVRTRNKTRKDIIKLISKGINEKPMFSSTKPTKILKKKKKNSGEDWYETWENLISLIKVFDAINARERKLKEKAKKIQESKQARKGTGGLAE